MSISDMYVGPLHAHDIVTLKNNSFCAKMAQKLCFRLYSWNYQSLTHSHTCAHAHTHTHTTAFTKEHLLCKLTYTTLSLKI